MVFLVMTYKRFTEALWNLWTAPRRRSIFQRIAEQRQRIDSFAKFAAEKKETIEKTESIVTRLEAQGSVTPAQQLGLSMLLASVTKQVAEASQSTSQSISAANREFNLHSTPENQAFAQMAERRVKEGQAALGAAIASLECAGLTYLDWLVSTNARIVRLKTWKAMSGVEFEYYIASHLNANGFAARCTRATADGGIDVNAVYTGPKTTPLISPPPAVGSLYAIQCKRYIESHAVGEPAIRDFYGAITATSPDARGVFITTSRFTVAAVAYAAKVGIHLVDGAELERQLSAAT